MGRANRFVTHLRIESIHLLDNGLLSPSPPPSPTPAPKRKLHTTKDSLRPAKRMKTRGLSSTASSSTAKDDDVQGVIEQDENMEVVGEDNKDPNPDDLQLRHSSHIRSLPSANPHSCVYYYALALYVLDQVVTISHFTFDSTPTSRVGDWRCKAALLRFPVLSGLHVVDGNAAPIMFSAHGACRFRNKQSARRPVLKK